LEDLSREKERALKLLMSSSMVPHSLFELYEFWRSGADGPWCAEIKAAGGKAVADYNSVVNGDKIVETAVKAFGTVHILLNNAGMTPFNKFHDVN
jgi:NAD(P)-dependent dehydrogenase (short-subunit alcohol dehydrogenase family)